MTGKPATIDAYLATLPGDQAVALQTLRDQINAALPDNVEVTSYAMPGHLIGKRVIAGYAGFATHCGFYPHSGNIMAGFKAELAELGLQTSKSGLLFTPSHPIPNGILTRIIAARLEEVGL